MKDPHASVHVRARELEAPGRAVIATDADGTVIYWGAGAEDLYGWTETEAVGRAIVDVTPGDLSREDARAIMQQLANGKTWSGEFLVCAKNGTSFMAHVTDVPVRDAAGRLVGIIGMSRRVNPTRG